MNFIKNPIIFIKINKLKLQIKGSFFTQFLCLLQKPILSESGTIKYSSILIYILNFFVK